MYESGRRRHRNVHRRYRNWSRLSPAAADGKERLLDIAAVPIHPHFNLKVSS